MKIKNRLFLLYAVSLAFVLTFFMLVLSISLNYIFDLKMKTALKSIALDIKDELVNDTFNINDAKFINEEFVIKPIYIEVFKKGKPVIKSKNLKDKNLPIINKEFVQIEIPFVSKEDESAIYALKTQDYTILAATPLERIDDVMEKFIFLSAVFASVLYAVLLYIGYKLINATISPMKEITLSAKKISAKNLNKRVYLPNTNDEFYELANIFNIMLDNLQISYEKIKRFNANVSHELKTPLTIIKGEIEVALKKDRDKEEYKEVLTSVLEEAQSMEKIVENMLILSRSEKIKKSELRVDEIVKSAFKEKENKAKMKKISFEIEKIDPVSIKGNENLLKEAILNVIDNAIKYTPSFKNIKISLIKEKENIKFIVKDEGIGIDSKNLDKVFESFYREDNSRSKEIEGYGLGLSIVEWIVKAHNGKIEIDSKKDIGTTVTIILQY